MVDLLGGSLIVPTRLAGTRWTYHDPGWQEVVGASKAATYGSHHSEVVPARAWLDHSQSYCFNSLQSLPGTVL